MKNFITFLVSFLFAFNLFAEGDFGVKISGFVKNDMFFDTRETVAAREGHFLLWPAPEVNDVNGEDVNEKLNYNILAIQSRLSFNLTGPEAFGAETRGKIEGDFFAQSNVNINLLRLRHAYLVLDWGNTELLAGQYWNPMFVTSCFPSTVSFNTGSPFQPFARNPQIRLTQSMGKVNLIAAILSQRDYASRGPQGASSAYLRNSGKPDFHFQAHLNIDNFNAGVGAEYKAIVPELRTDEGYKTDTEVGGLSGLAFFKIKTKPITFKLEGTYGNNIPDLLLASGYAVKSIEETTGIKEYLPISNLSVWSDIHTNGKNFQFGVFGGYYENLGTTDDIMNNISDPVFGLGTNIATMFRVSPRVIFNSGKSRIAGEIEYSSVDFGDGSFSEKAIPQNTTNVVNIRFLIAMYYFF